MSSRQIEVVVSPTGETRIATKGFQGSKCQEATKALEAALGQKLAETLTAEYHLVTVREASLAEHQNIAR